MIAVMTATGTWGDEIIENGAQHRNHPASMYVTVAVLVYGKECFFITDAKIRARVL